MKNSQPSALQMPEHRRRETVEAVYEALGIINERIRSPRVRWEETWKTTGRTTTHTIKMLREPNRGLGVAVSLVVGSSQQRRIKRCNRRIDVRRKSYLIAQETGADFNEVKDLYFKMMNQYIENDL